MRYLYQLYDNICHLMFGVLSAVGTRIGAARQERILRERLSQWMRMLEAGTPALSLRDVLVNVRRQDTSAAQAVRLSKAERV